ncbi:MAG TPA: SET domain-containing protein-lysine N-methyltransferase [Anaerolineales bacterium]
MSNSLERFELQLKRNSRQDVRSIIEQAAKSLGLVTAQVTTLSTFPGSIHWHFKQANGRGTLEATYWPDRRRAWLSVRPGREAEWIAPAIRALKRLVAKGAKAHRKRLYSIRRSPIHGRGVFAIRRIPKGTRVIEYRGERISQEEATRRYEETMEYPFTYLFEVDEETIIDGQMGGNTARYINHSCSPNCESLNSGGRIFIEAIRDIRPGEELTYDYRLETEEPMTRRLQKMFACNCGTRRCRGTLLNVE